MYHGEEGFRRFWRDFHEIWQTLSMELREVIERGDRVAFSFHFDATGRDGMRTGRDQASVATLRNGLLLRIENYGSWDEAVEALKVDRG